jgi:hypothetical protein
MVKAYRNRGIFVRTMISDSKFSVSDNPFLMQALIEEWDHPGRNS